MQDIEKKYKNYKTEELIYDSFFIESIKRNNETDYKLWNALIDRGIINESSFEEAKNIILNINNKYSFPINEGEEDIIWDKINSTLARKKKKRKLYLAIGSVAASIAIITFSYISRGKEAVKLDTIYYSDLMEKFKGDSASAQLILSHTHIPLEGKEIQVENTEDGNVFVSDMEYENDSVGFNHLIIPYGKRSKLILEDGTKLWVNANSHIIYPAKFNKNRREIFIEGEVFADVAKDVERPFIVKTLNSTIEVLGTSFNIKAHKESSSESIVLVTGSIRLKHKEEQLYLLKPNEEFIATETGSLIRKADTANIIAWIDGYYKFREEKLSTILEKLSEFYGYKIAMHENIESIKCTGGIDLREDIEQVIKGLTKTLGINYRKDKNTILIY